MAPQPSRLRNMQKNKLICEAIFVSRGYRPCTDRVELGAAAHEIPLTYLPGRLPIDLSAVAILRASECVPSNLSIRVFHREIPRPLFESDAFVDHPVLVNGKYFLASSLANVQVKRPGEYRVELRESELFLAATSVTVLGSNIGRVGNRAPGVLWEA